MNSISDATTIACFRERLSKRKPPPNYVVLNTCDFCHIGSGFTLDMFGEVGACSLLVSQCIYPPMALGIRMARGACCSLLSIGMPLPLLTEGRYSWHSQHTCSLPPNVANDHSNSYSSRS
jgi:hypothetical protein